MKRQSKFTGHAMREDELEHILTTRKSDGKEAQIVQQRKSQIDWQDGIEKYAKTTHTDNRRHIVVEIYDSQSQKELTWQLETALKVTHIQLFFFFCPLIDTD